MKKKSTLVFAMLALVVSVLLVWLHFKDREIKNFSDYFFTYIEERRREKIENMFPTADVDYFFTSEKHEIVDIETNDSSILVTGYIYFDKNIGNKHKVKLQIKKTNEGLMIVDTYGLTDLEKYANDAHLLDICKKSGAFKVSITDKEKMNAINLCEKLEENVYSYNHDKILKDLSIKLQDEVYKEKTKEYSATVLVKNNSKYDVSNIAFSEFIYDDKDFMYYFIRSVDFGAVKSGYEVSKRLTFRSNIEPKSPAKLKINSISFDYDWKGDEYIKYKNQLEQME